MSFDSLPIDIVQLIISNYCGIFCEDDLDERPLPASFVALLFVSKMLYRVVMNKKHLPFLAIQNFRNSAPCRRRETYAHLMQAACRTCSSASLIEWLHTYLGYPLSKECWLGAAEGCNLELLNFLKRNGISRGWSDYDSLAIVSSGRVEMVRWMRETVRGWGFLQTQDIFHTALQEGKLEVVEYLCGERGCKPTHPRSIQTALQAGNAFAVQFLLAKGAQMPSEKTSLPVQRAVRRGLSHVRILHEQFLLPIDNMVVQQAATFGCTDVLEYLHEKQQVAVALDQLFDGTVTYLHPDSIRFCVKHQFDLSAYDRIWPLGLLFDPSRTVLKFPLRLAASQLLAEHYRSRFCKELADFSYLLMFHFVPVQMWRVLISVGVSLTAQHSTDILRNTFLSPSVHTLATVRYLMEELHPPFAAVPGEDMLRLIRKDVYAYAKELRALRPTG